MISTLSAQSFSFSNDYGLPLRVDVVNVRSLEAAKVKVLSALGVQLTMTMLYESRIDPGQVVNHSCNLDNNTLVVTDGRTRFRMENGTPTLTVENASFVFALDPERRILQAQYMTSVVEANWKLPLASF